MNTKETFSLGKPTAVQRKVASRSALMSWSENHSILQSLMDLQLMSGLTAQSGLVTKFTEAA